VIARLLAASAMLAVAVLLVLFARDTWHWSRAMRDADARAATGYVGPEAWNAETTLPPGFVRRVLALDDDLTFRREAVQALRQAAHVPNAKEQRERLVLESALARLSRDEGSPARAASAADDLGALLYFDPPSPSGAQNPYQDPSKAAPSGVQTPSERARAEFELAVRLDPGNAIAQRNLEVLLRETSPTSNRERPRAGRGERRGAKGAGSRLPGHGY
jgi:hypothetical protein